MLFIDIFFKINLALSQDTASVLMLYMYIPVNNLTVMSDDFLSSFALDKLEITFYISTHSHVPVKLNLPLYIRRYTSPN